MTLIPLVSSGQKESNALTKGSAMKKLSQRTTAVALSLPIMLGSTVALSTPAHAYPTTSQSCVYEVPPASAGQDGPSKSAVAQPCPKAYIPPAPPVYPATHAYAEPPGPVSYSAEAEYLKSVAEAQRDQAVFIAVTTGGLVAICFAALAFIALRSRKLKD